PAVYARHQQYAQVIQSQLRKDPADYEAGPPQKIVGYIAVGGSDDYFLDQFQALSFTLEGIGEAEEQRFEVHERMWDSVFQKLTSELPPVAPQATPGFIRVYLTDQITANGSLSLIVGSDVSAHKFELCYGGSECASGAGRALPLRQAATKGAYKIFVLDSALNLTNGNQLSILARDQSNKIIKA